MLRIFLVYWQTIKYLKLIQIFYRLIKFLPNKKIRVEKIPHINNFLNWKNYIFKKK